MKNEATLLPHAELAGERITSQMTLDMANVLVLIHDLRGVLERLEELRSEGNSDAEICLLYTSPSPRDRQKSRMPSSA